MRVTLTYRDGTTAVIENVQGIEWIAAGVLMLKTFGNEWTKNRDVADFAVETLVLGVEVMPTRCGKVQEFYANATHAQNWTAQCTKVGGHAGRHEFSSGLDEAARMRRGR